MKQKDLRLYSRCCRRFKRKGVSKMVVKKETVVRVIVEGAEPDKSKALMALLRDADKAEIREAIKYLAPSQVIHMAQVCHGRMYQMLLGKY